jgi:hypothetical protein
MPGGGCFNAIREERKKFHFFLALHKSDARRVRMKNLSRPSRPLHRLLTIIQLVAVAGLSLLLAATPAAASSRLVNLSTRADVGTGNNVVIAGIIILGYQAETLVFRGLGPSLPFANNMPNPVLELYNGNGTPIVGNDNWQDGNGAEISATGLAPTNALESALKLNLDPGSYTAILSCNGGCTGMGMVEVYDITPLPSSARLVNMSTRAHSENDDGKEILGMIIQGSGNKSLLLRGIGPSIPMPDTLPNPFLQLYGPNGGLRQLNDNWKDTQQSAIAATGAAPANDLESAMIASVEPNPFTVKIQDNSGATGIANIEVYDLDPAPTPFPPPQPTPPPQRLVWYDHSGATTWKGYGSPPTEMRRTNTITPIYSGGSIKVNWSASASSTFCQYCSTSASLWPEVVNANTGQVIGYMGGGGLTMDARAASQSFANPGPGVPFYVRIMAKSDANPNYADQINLYYYEVYSP